MAKTMRVEGVDLASGLWWVHGITPEYHILVNRRQQRMILRQKEISRLKFKPRRIKISEDKK